MPSNVGCTCYTEIGHQERGKETAFITEWLGVEAILDDGKIKWVFFNLCPLMWGVPATQRLETEREVRKERL
jgi:hypothetical protein